MQHLSKLTEILMKDPFHKRVLDLIRSLDSEDCWVGAGLVRNAVWDALHNRSSIHNGDVDVIFFNLDSDNSDEMEMEVKLQAIEPTIDWSVKNQAHMHVRNGDLPYSSSFDAMKYWPETATAVAARLDNQGNIEIAAPYGLHDLFDLVVKPTPAFVRQKRQIFEDRVRKKKWLETWPLLKVQA